MEAGSRPQYEWSNEKVLHFLELYFMESPIWNPNDVRHKDRNEVFDAWKRLEEALGFQYSITELKKKRENLMSTYRKLQNKVRTSRMIGEVFKPDWFAYETMARYLNDLYDSRSTRQCEEGEDPISEFEESALSEEDIKDFEVPVNPEHVVVNTPETTCNPSARSRKRKKQCPEDTAPEENNPKKQAAEEPSAPDEVSLFTDLLAVKLRALNDGLRETAMFEINSAMYHLKMQQMNQAYPGSCASPCAAHMPGYSLRGCPRFCAYSCPPTPQMKTPQQNSRQ